MTTKLFSRVWSRTFFTLTFLTLPLTPLLTRVAEAATYYVATTGSDTAGGSSAAPWKSLQHAADRAAAGDTIIVARELRGLRLGYQWHRFGPDQL